MSVEFSGGTNLGPTYIPELTADPVSPAPQTAWVLHSPLAIGGSPIGLLLALTTSTIPGDYEFSYKTIEGPIVRVVLS